MASGWVRVSRSLLPLQLAVAGDETLAAEMTFVESKALDLRAHRAVEHKDAFGRDVLERGQRVHLAGACVEGLIERRSHSGILGDYISV